MKLINDPYFRVEIDRHASSPGPEIGIWHGQHTCVAEGFSLDDAPPKEPGNAIVKHQLKVEHYSVLRFAYLVLHCSGFSHAVMTQIARHQDAAHLVQSGRYTGARFIKIANGEAPIESGFYFRPLGTYQDRGGHRYEYTEKDLEQDRVESLKSACLYADRISRGWAEEHARDGLRYNFRQNFAIAGDLQAVFHWLDQRSKADSQLEIQSLAAMAMERVIEFSPTLGTWYKESRYGKARLAP